MVKAIIFDLDGTLLDTSKDIHYVLNGCLKKFNLPQISYEDTVKFVGNGAKKLVERALGLQNIHMLEEVYANFAVDFEKCANDNTHLYEGEEQALRGFKNNGIKLALITNKPQRAAERVFDRYLKKFGFDIVMGQSEKFPLKPDPTSTLEVIKSLNVLKSECLFVGDGETDVQTAKNAGIDCIACLWGFRRKEQLAKAGARLFAQNYAEIEQFVYNKNN